MTKELQLTNYLNISDKGHILYFFEDQTNYLNNLIAYIKAGIERNHHLLIIENASIYQKAQMKINHIFSLEEQKFIHYIDNDSFYLRYGDFITHKIVAHFADLLEPFLTKDLTVRTWAHVEWNKSKDIEIVLEEFEKCADCSVNKMGLMSVCAYDSSDVSATLQTAMLRSHEYLMTDNEFVRSSFYRKYERLGEST